MAESTGQKLFQQNNKPDAKSNGNSNSNNNIVGYLTAGSLFKKDRKFTFHKNQKNLYIPQQEKISHRNTFNSEKVQAKYSQKPYLTQRVRKNNNYFDDSFKITQFTNTQNTVFQDSNFTISQEKDDSLSKYQHKIVQQNLRKPNFDRNRQSISNKVQVSPIKYLKKSPQKNQNIPNLQNSRKRYFSLCRQEAEKYLVTLQTQLKQSQENIRKAQTHVRNKIKQDINEKALQLKAAMLKMIDQFVEEWKLSQIQFYKMNQMKFLGDTKQLLAQIQERQKLLQQFNAKLQFQQEQNWKKVTAQLLYFDYDSSIKQIHKMSENMMNTVHQKYNLAMNIRNQNGPENNPPFKFQDIQRAKLQLIRIFVKNDLVPLYSFAIKKKGNNQHQQDKNLHASFGEKAQQKY